MNPYIGDRQLEPDDDEPIICQGCDKEFQYQADFDIHFCSDSDPGEPNEEPE